MRTIVLGLGCLLMGAVGCAYAAGTAPPLSASGPAVSSAASVDAATTASVRPPLSNTFAKGGCPVSSAPTAPDAIDGARVVAELAQSEARINQRLDALKPDPFVKWLPGVFVILGAMIAAAAGYFTQERLTRRAAGRSAVAEVMAFRSRQLNEFYAPLRAMQGQGLAIRNQLYDQLLANPFAGYQFTKLVDAKAANGWSLWYTHAGVDKPFRMIDDLPLLHLQAPQLMPMVDQIISIGDSTSKLIRDHGGLALPENDELTEMLGAFLAHHAIFKHLRDTVATPTSVKYTAIYPRGFDKVIKQDFETLSSELRRWSDSAKAMAAS